MGFNQHNDTGVDAPPSELVFDQHGIHPECVLFKRNEERYGGCNCGGEARVRGSVVWRPQWLNGPLVTALIGGVTQAAAADSNEELGELLQRSEAPSTVELMMKWRRSLRQMLER